MKSYLIIVAIFISLFTTALSADRFSYRQVHSMPKSIEKDYYIWRLLKQKNTSKKQAISIIKDAKRINGKLKKAYKKKVGTNIPKKPRKRVVISDAKKAKLHLRQKKAKEITTSKNPFTNWLKQENNFKIFVFNNVGRSGRQKLNGELSPRLWSDLTTHRSFNKSIKLINIGRYGSLKKSFLYMPAKKNALTYDSDMLLGFNAVTHDKLKVAIRYFSDARRKGYQREQVDRAMFWQYLISKDKSILRKLIKGHDMNIYTLLARDFLKLKYPKGLAPVLPKASLISKKNIDSPIYWAKLKKKIFSKKHNLYRLADDYKSADTVGYYTYIRSTASKDLEQYFPMPYRDLLHKLPKSRQAILYAIARQESRFIPGSISSSYALGLMQLMPFLIDDLAKKRKEHIDYDDMFNPRTALVYANDHMNYLTKWLQHPLFVAYAYNAGIGYTRRMLNKKKLFQSFGRFEPYLSIERLDNAQANRYGKHVLANYVIYMNKLGKHIRMIDLMRTLHMPSKTDKFRR